MAKQHIVKSVFWLTLSEILYNISGYVIHSGVGRILGPEDYGRYGIVITLTTMIIILIGNGIPTAMSKFLSEVFESNPSMISVIKKTAIKMQVLIMGAITVLFYLLAPLTAKILGDPSLTHLFRISTLIVPSFAAASFYFYYFTGIHRFNLQAILKSVRSISRVFFILLLAWFFRVEGSVVGYIIAPFFVFVIAYFIDKLSISPKIEEASQVAEKKPHEFHWKKLLNYAWPMTLFMLFYELMISIDLYLVKGLLLNDYLTGIYNGALTIARIPYFLFYALTIVLLPTISKTTSQQDHVATKKVINQTYRLFSFFLFPTIVLMTAYATPAAILFYGERYALAGDSIQILVSGMSFLTVFYVLSFIINGAGKVKLPMWTALFGMILNIILNYILIPKYSLIGASIATSLSSLVVMILGIYLIKKEFNVVPELSSTLKMFFASVVIFLFSKFLPGGNYIFILWSLLLSSAYFIILYVLGEFKEEDFRLVKKLTKK